MKRNRILAYNNKKSVIHELSGATKLVCFLLMSFVSMLTFDVRVLIGVLVFSYVVLLVSRTEWKEISVAFVYIGIFLLFNLVTTFVFSPDAGADIYGTRHVIATLSQRYTITLEQLFYEGTKLVKYMSLVPFGLMLFITTDPSEFASSLNRLGVNYKICTTLSLTLRYFPEVQRDYLHISQAEQARGIDMGKNTRLSEKVKFVVSILIPLLFSTLDRIELISNAMELRSYGKKDKRTWYNSRPFGKNDYLAIGICVAILVVTLAVRIFVNHSFYWNPFI
mgnify:CR=1 FL=1